MEMSPETIKALLDAFDRSDWREMVVTVGEDRLHVSRDPLPDSAVHGAGSSAGPVTAGDPPPLPVAKASSGAVPPTAPPPEESAQSTGGSGQGGGGDAAVPVAGEKIESPSVGLFWRAPAPGAAPFVEVGQAVAAGETVAIVEVMKLMNHVASPVDGVVTAILVENGAPVEFGQTIVVVDPEG
ncbi:MAG TPA: biotin/lipoyl-containing protein [Solirubrobacterales bacterium]|nr:biotin/lipoyl-containing protein [Solirubrobacterales bacterium]